MDVFGPVLNTIPEVGSPDIFLVDSPLPTCLRLKKSLTKMHQKQNNNEDLKVLTAFLHLKILPKAQLQHHSKLKLW